MTTWTDITVGRLTLRETFELAANISAGTDTRTLVLAGQESFPPLTLAQVKQRQEDILGLQNRLVPIRFGTKSDHDGWYRISDVNTSVIDYQGNEVRAFNWGINAQFIGPDNAVDLESRLDGISRINDHGLSGERWHAPAGGAYAYYTGTSQPSGSVSRASSDGLAVTAWRSVPASTHPRWASSLDNYGVGRVRVAVDGLERVATGVTLGANSWRLDNGLVYVVPADVAASASFHVACWDGTGWESTAWNINVGASTGTGLYNWSAATILRNDYEVCTIRLIKDRNPGRTLLDLTLRRGSRVVEGYLQTDSSNLLAAYLKTAQASTAAASSGYVVATSNDAQGNKVLVGSARSFNGLTAQGGLAKAAATKLDFYIGAVVAGSSAVAGDAASVINSHYLTSMSDVTLAARR